MQNISKMKRMHKIELERENEVEKKSGKKAKALAKSNIDNPFETPIPNEKRQNFYPYRPEWYPWDAIENIFVRGAPDKSGAIHYPTISDLADHFKIPYQTVSHRMKNFDWMKKRADWQRQYQKAVQEQSVDDLYATALRFDAKCIEAAELAIQEIVFYFLEAKANDDRISKLDLDRMGRSAVNWQKVGRLALGLSTENQAAKLETTNSGQVQSLDLTNATQEELELLEKLALASNTRILPPQNIIIEEEQE